MAIKVLRLCAVDFTLAKFLTPLCLFLRDQGFDVTAACTEGDFFPDLRDKGLRCVNLPIDRSMNPRAHFRSYFRLSAWLKAESFDIIHVHTPIASLIGRLAGARRGVPIRLYTAHGFYFHDDMPWKQRLFHIALERFGALFHHFLFTQSDEDRESALRYGFSKPDRILTIGNGVDTQRFDPHRFSSDDRIAMRQSLGIDPNALVLGIIGRLVREKGYYELFDALARLLPRFPDLRLLVIGDALASDHDDHSENFQRAIDRLGIRKAIVFAGQRSDVPELLQTMDLFTLPSYREGMPRSVIEAMMMGLPCVVTNIRGCREEIVDGECGYIVPVRDAHVLSEKCGQLLENAKLRKTMGDQARHRAHERYSEELVLQRQLMVYRQLIAERLNPR